MLLITKKSCLGVYRRMCALALICVMGASHAQSLSKMALLVPDGLPLTAVQVTAWTDAAKEQGYVLSILRNADFLLAGPGIRAQYSGIIVPDQTQVTMSDALVSTLENYVTQGGNIMLVFDAGALTSGGFYAIPKSRFSNLVGVDYVLYDALRDRTVGLGPVFGSVSTLRALQVPPGKSMLYTPPVAAAITTRSTLSTQTTSTEQVATFLIADPTNPSGLKGYDHSQYFKSQKTKISLSHEGKSIKEGNAIKRASVGNVTTTSSLASQSTSLVTADSSLATAAVVEPSHNISGYVYGPLTYPSFVTQGTTTGSVLLSSAAHGLVASSRSVGSGNVLFVNMPLTYLKLSEDAMPMHGFLHWFARNVLKQPRLTAVPNGVGGLVFNWHLDSAEALQPMQQLKNQGVWKNKPFSMHMTAGPDTIVPGDRLGFNLPSNPTAQQFLKDFDSQGHEVGSHGGWIHDYYGGNVNETNEASFLNYLVLNRDAIQTVLGHSMKEYSAPQGNNPLWALNWLSQNGFGSYYSLSHTGTATTRTYRGSQLVVPSMWAVPVTPFGVAATFEEFKELAIPVASISQWYTDLIDFAVANQTNRMIYAHPPGAVDYPTVMNSLLQYANLKKKAGQFNWYTMAQVAEFMNKREGTTWQSGLFRNGKMRVTASNPANLRTLAWTFPKSLYARPVAVSGSMIVVDQGTDWLVRVTGGKSAEFEAAPL